LANLPVGSIDYSTIYKLQKRIFAKKMEAPHLKIKPEDCSAIGLLILEHGNLIDYKYTTKESR